MSRRAVVLHAATCGDWLLHVATLDRTSESLLDAVAEVSAEPGEIVGRVKVSVGHQAVPLVITPVVPTFRARHPRIEVEIVVEERLVDIVGEGYDASIRLTESIDRDLMRVRLPDELRFVIVGAPEYLAKHGTPRKPEDLLRREYIGYRARTTGAVYAWELERGRRHWRVPGRGGVVSNEPQLGITLAEQGHGARVHVRAIGGEAAPRRSAVA